MRAIKFRAWDKKNKNIRVLIEKGTLNELLDLRLK
jgi:hypothetical protein